MAPELLVGRDYGLPADIYALAIVRAFSCLWVLHMEGSPSRVRSHACTAVVVGDLDLRGAVSKSWTVQDSAACFRRTGAAHHSEGARDTRLPIHVVHTGWLTLCVCCRTFVHQWAPREFAELIQRMWAHDPSRRPTASQVVTELSDIATAITGAPVPTPVPATLPMSPDIHTTQQRLLRGSIDLELQPGLPKHIQRSLLSGRLIVTG